MPTLQTYSNRVQELIHDLNLIDFTQDRLNSKINQARARAALDLKCCRVFYDGLSVIPKQERYPMTGGVGGVKLLSGGQNYVAPRVAFVGGGGQGAAATVTQVGGVCTAVTMTNWGFGYGSTPVCNIIDGAGWVTNAQIRYALAAVANPANASILVFNAIQALPVTDPANIQWNSGAPTIPGDALYLKIIATLGFNNAQMGNLYSTAALFSDPPQIAPTNENIQSPYGQTLVATFAVTNKNLRTVLAKSSVGLITPLFNAISPLPSDPANIIWHSGASSVPGDALSLVMQNSLGMTPDEVMSIYQQAQLLSQFAFAISGGGQVFTVTNQQLKTALANAGLLTTVQNNISSSLSDPVNIQWFSRDVSSSFDSLYNLINNVTSASVIYAAAALLPSNAPGKGALATAVTMRNVVDWNQVNIIFGTDRPTIFWAPWPIFQAYARSSTTGQLGMPRMWVTFPENNYAMFYSVPDQVYGAEIEAITLPDRLINLTDEDTQLLPPNDEPVAYYAAHLCFLFLQQYGPANYYSSDDPLNPGKYERAIRRIAATKSPVRMPNIYSSTGFRVQKWYGG